MVYWSLIVTSGAMLWPRHGAVTAVSINQSMVFKIDE